MSINSAVDFLEKDSMFTAEFNSSDRSFKSDMGESGGPETDERTFAVGFQENNSMLATEFDSTSQIFESGIGEVNEIVTSDHRRLTNRSAKNQHPIESITGLKDALEEAANFGVGHGLKVEGEKTLCVNTVSDFEGDNTLPITAAAVQTTVGNIELILATI